MSDLLMNFDLNQEPSSPAPSPPRFASVFDEHDTSRRPIVDRFRFAISASARQPQTALTLMPITDPIVGVNRKRDVTQLAKALEMDLDANKTDADDDDDKAVDNDNRVFFDCNICLHMAKDPILTCCGHLFCWGCFYQVPYVDSVSKECPVCNGEVTDSNVTPIYGNGNMMMESNSRVRIPPRPQAHRIESVGPQSLDNNPLADAIRNLRINLRNRDANSVVHASVNIQPQAQSYVGPVENDVAVSSSRRRRRRRLR